MKPSGFNTITRSFHIILFIICPMYKACYTNMHDVIRSVLCHAAKEIFLGEQQIFHFFH